MCLVGDGVECGIYIVYDFRERQFEESVLVVWQEVGRYGSEREILCRLAGSGLLAEVAVGHDDNHRHTLSFGNEVVHDARHVAQVEPCSLVATTAMEKIEYRIFLVGLAISGRQIHIHTAVGVGRVGVIPYRAHLAMVHILYQIFVGSAATHIEDAEYVAHIAARKRIYRVDAQHTVDVKAIGEHFGCELWSGILPYSILAFLHCSLAVVLLPVSQYLHTLGLGRFHAEGYGVVVVYLWRNDVALTK